MFSHIMIGSNDIARSKKFYDTIFGVLGVSPATPDARGRISYAHNGGRFIVTKPIDGKAASAANGGTSIEDPPGIRQGPAGQMYLAYLRDPDGNKIVGLHRVPA